jgi:hypothetical protein
MFDFSKIDLGIALCHFDLTCRELRIAGKFEVLTKVKNISISKDKYSVTWIKSTPRPY